jgi:hypothetical protein
VKVCVTFDLDQDGATGLSPERNAISWEGLKLLPRIVDELIGRGIRATAFVRCDQQISDLLGDSLALLDSNAPALERLARAGGEVGWHPHLYRRSGERYAPIRDADEACDQLVKIRESAVKAGFQARSVRLGESWHAAGCMRTLDQLGLEVDSTALPGRKRVDPTLSFDWEPSPNEPYHPSHSDHRIPGGRPLGILEIPMSTAPVRTSYDPAPLRRYINLAFPPALFREAIEGFLAERKGSHKTVLVLIFHPGELLPGSPNGLCAQSWQAFVENLDFVPAELKRQGQEAEYRSLIEIRDNLASTPGG